MNKHLENLLQGMAELVAFDRREYDTSMGGGFKQDALSMRSDFKMLGKDMREALKKYEQTQTYSR